MRRRPGDRPLLTLHLQGYQLPILILGAMAAIYAATSTQDWPPRVAILGLWAVLSLWLQRVRVEVHTDVLLVRNGFRVVRVPWEQVLVIHAETDPVFGPTAVIRLRAGGRIRIDALTTGRGGDGDLVRDRVAQLERWRHGRPPSPRTTGVTPVVVRRDGYWARGPVQVGVGFLIAGILASSGGAYLLSEAQRFAAHGRRISAVVTSVERSGKYSTVTVSYEVGGTRYTEQAVEWLGTPRPGDTVQVTYDATDPHHVTDAAVGGTRSGFGEALVVLLLGLVSIGGAVAVMVRSRVRTGTGPA